MYVLKIFKRIWWINVLNSLHLYTRINNSFNSIPFQKTIKALDEKTKYSMCQMELRYNGIAASAEWKNNREYNIIVTGNRIILFFKYERYKCPHSQLRFNSSRALTTPIYIIDDYMLLFKVDFITLASRLKYNSELIIT